MSNKRIFRVKRKNQLTYKVFICNRIYIQGLNVYEYNVDAAKPSNLIGSLHNDVERIDLFNREDSTWSQYCKFVEYGK